MLLARIDRNPLQGLIAAARWKALVSARSALWPLRERSTSRGCSNVTWWPRRWKRPAPSAGRAPALQQHLGRGLPGEVGPEGRPRQAPALPHLSGIAGDGCTWKTDLARSTPICSVEMASSPWLVGSVWGRLVVLAQWWRSGCSPSHHMELSALGATVIIARGCTSLALQLMRD